MKRAISIILSIMFVLAIILPATAISTIAVKSIKLDSSNITLKAGQTYNLKATLTPANTTQKSLTYVTGNNKIATVDKAGKITGVAAGTTTITVYTSNKTISAKCKVTVSPPQKPVTFRMLQSGISKTLLSTDDEIGKMIKDKFNVTFEYVPVSEATDTKASMMLAANNFGNLDLVCTRTDVITKQYIAAGALLKLDDYKKTAPNFFSYEKDLIPYWRNFDSKNGDLYVWQAAPDQIQMTSEPLDICTRVDVLKAMGWPKLDTTDDYISFLKGAMQKFPTSLGQKSIGMIFFWGESLAYDSLALYLPRASGYQDFYSMIGMVDVKNSKIIPKFANPVAKESLQFYNTLYREGIMDKEAFTDKMSTMQSKFESGVALTAHFAKWMIPGVNAKLTAAGHPEMSYIVTPIRLTSAKTNGYNRYELYNGVRSDETTGILKQCKNPDRLMEVINFLSTKEMTDRIGWGVEGRDYTVKNGVKSLTNEDLNILKTADKDGVFKKRGIAQDIWGKVFPVRFFGMGDNGQANCYGNDSGYLMASATATQLEAYKAYGYKTMMDAWTKNPSYKFIPFDITKYVVAANLDPKSDVAKIELDINNYLYQQVASMITAKTESDFNSIYDESVKKIASMGAQKVLDQDTANLNAEQARLNELKNK